MNDAQKAVRFVRAALKARANPAKAKDMQAYMKTDMPFYGVQKPARTEIARELRTKFPITSRKEYETVVRALWAQPHREEKYLALTVARVWKAYIVPASMPLYRRIIVEGAWWDFVDETADHLVGAVYRKERATIRPTIEKWIDDKNMWLRRTAIIAQLTHKKDTDEEQLFRFCLRRAHEKEFFIRKAIGWALRQHAYTSPRAVKRFLNANRATLSPLSFREAAKHLEL